MVVPETPVHPAGDRPPIRAGFDLVPHLVRFLEGPAPVTLLVTGASGTGKSALLRTLIPRLPGPGLFLAYRTEAPPGPSDAPSLAVLVVDPGAPTDEPALAPIADPTQSLSFAPVVLRTGETLPPVLGDGISRQANRGGGFVMVDSWDAGSEELFRAQAAGHGRIAEVRTSIGFMRGQFGRLPVRSLIAFPSAPDPELLSGADGVVELGWEEVEGFRLRVVSVPKLRRSPTPETRYLYSLREGVFYCPPQFAPGFRPPIGPPPPDPDPSEAGLFPGSVAFAGAFGRLRPHGMTGLEVAPRFPSSLTEVFLYPLVAHTLSVGGRVVWIPSASSGPPAVVAALTRFLPPDFLRERLRVLAPGPGEAALGELRAVVLPVRRESGEVREASGSGGAGVGPFFPEAHHFLRSTPEGRPSLYVISLDGLSALASIAGIPLNAETFPLIVGAYLRLPRFHGFGFGRSDDPLTRVMAAAVDTHLRVEERYGRTVLFGIRPRTNPYILDWGDDAGRYSLVQM